MKNKAVMVTTEDETQAGLIEATNVGWFVAVDQTHAGSTTEVLQMKSGEVAIDENRTRFEIKGWGSTPEEALNDAD